MSTKTLEELAKTVIDSQEGLVSTADLEALFSDGTVTPAPTSVQSTAGPVISPTITAPSTASTVPPVEPTKEEPTILEFVPEKFRDKDPKVAMQKWHKSYSELESELAKQKDEMANLNKIVKTLSEPEPKPIVAPTQLISQVTDDDVEDSTFFDKPKEAVSKVAAKIAAQTVMQYHTIMERARKVQEFRGAHVDFDELRSEMADILKARPDLDQNVDNLPYVYDTAKKMRTKRLEALRDALGVQIQPTIPTQPTQPTVTADQMVEIEKKAFDKAKEALLEEIRRRRAASGNLGGTTTTPSDRTQPTTTTKPKSDEDVVMDEMMAAGRGKVLDLAL